MNEVYEDLNKLRDLRNQLSDSHPLLDQMIKEKEQIIEVHQRQLQIQGARELVTEIFGSAMATKMGVL
tara:strand:+ start:425 stop:628 length:204 start_codon:yes stop_codon:yes gene_type:complete